MEMTDLTLSQRLLIAKLGACFRSLLAPSVSRRPVACSPSANRRPRFSPRPHASFAPSASRCTVRA